MSDLRSSIRVSLRMEQVGFHWTDFYKIWDLGMFGRYVKVQI